MRPVEIHPSKSKEQTSSYENVSSFSGHYTEVFVKEPFLIGRFLGVEDECNHKMAQHKRLKRHTTLAVLRKRNTL